MRIDLNQCLSCGSRRRPEGLETSLETTCGLQPDGALRDSPYWFCSVDCYKTAVRKYLDKKYDFDTEPEDAPEIQEKYRALILEYQYESGSSFGIVGVMFNKTAWTSQHDYVFSRLKPIVEKWKGAKLAHIFNAETDLFDEIWAEHSYREQVERQKEQERLKKEEAKQQAEDEKQRLKDEKEAEKKEAEEAARAAEEERWRPKPYKL